ncbi:hypothetical protein [Microbacterium invictum]|uniref:Uncharacterized protein n=1 Tax=Microbacterium invictum TaxID=515415 RepID=A0AA40SMA7_9MICO|nr:MULTISPECIES: hypothetical protein [Microbacterium]MBB4138720.1 hypothetical protein [Microbacterium invictum]
MRKLMVCNFVTVDGRYEDDDVAEWPHTRIVRIADACDEVRGVGGG